MKDLESIVEKGWAQLQASCAKVESLLKDKVLFEFRVMYQPGDGPVIEYDAHLAPLSTCYKIIERKGKLTLEDYLPECI